MQRASVLSGASNDPEEPSAPGQDDPTYFIRKLRDVIQGRRMTWNRNERRNSTQSWLTFFPYGREFPARPRMIIARFITFLRQNFHTDTFARSLSTHTHAREDAHMCANTDLYVYTCRGYISHRRSSLYVNCIRNSEYPTNFLHTDHSRISAKRTSIRRSLHHKFRRTWRNAHLVEAAASAFGMHQTSALLSPMLRLCPTDSRVFRVFVD